MLRAHCLTAGILDLTAGISAAGGHPILLAGAARDAIYATLTRQPLCPRDYDICVKGMCRDSFDEIAVGFGAERNRYGGYQLQHNGCAAIDLWRIEDTTGILAHSCSPTVTNVLRTFVLDLNAVAYDLVGGVMQDQGCLKALERRRIGFVRSPLSHDESNFAGRVLTLQQRFAFSLSPRMRTFVHDWYDPKETERHLAKSHRSLFGPRSLR